MAQALLIADTQQQHAVVQTGQPPTHIGAWFIEIPEGSDALTTAAAWVESQTFQVGTIMYLLDPATARKFVLQSNWVEQV